MVRVKTRYLLTIWGIHQKYSFFAGAINTDRIYAEKGCGTSQPVRTIPDPSSYFFISSLLGKLRFTAATTKLWPTGIENNTGMRDNGVLCD